MKAIGRVFAGAVVTACALSLSAAYSADQPAPAAEAPKVEETKPLREQTIYVPYGRIRDVFEKEGRGVFLPYEKFQELWQQARSKHVPEAAVRPPVAVLLVEADNEATVEKDVVLVRARIQIEVLGKGWHEVPLRLRDAAVRSATVDDSPARILFDPDTGYRLLLRSDQDEATRFSLALEYAKAFSKSPGQNSVRFEAPQVPVNRWRIRVPQAGVKVNVHPLIAATEVTAAAEQPPVAPPATPPATATPPTDEPEAAPPPAGEAAPSPPQSPATPPAAPPPAETQILAFVGAAPEVRIDWTPKAEGAAGLEALTSVQSEQEVTIQEGVVRTRVRLAYEITRAELSQLVVEVPADQKVTGVFDPNVRQWDVTAAEDKQTIRVQLFEATRGAQNLTVDLERFVDAVAASELAVPIVRAVGAGRQQGIVVVRLGDELQAETTRQEGLLQLDKAQLPASLQAGNWVFAYRYAALPFELVLKTQKVEPQIRTSELVEAFLAPDQLTYTLAAVLDIQRAGVFQLEVTIPRDVQVRQVRGHETAGATALQVDAHHVDEAEPTRLRINLAARAIGRAGLLVELQKPIDDANLTSPTGQASTVELPLPRLAGRIEHVQGHAIVYAPESLRVNPQKQVGLRGVSFAEALQAVPSVREGRFSELREVLAFAYAQSPVDFSLVVERRKPFVTVRQLLTVRVEAGVVKHEATFFYDVQYSPVKTFRIDVPAAWADKIRNLTPAIREVPLDPQPAGLADSGYVAWGFTGEAEFLGSAVIRLAWEDRQPELAIGQSGEYPLPVLRPMDVDRAWGQVVITKAETLDVHPKPGSTQLRPIDPQHDLMSGASVPDAARAFEFHDPNWSLTVTATRYELQEVKHTSIERALLRMVVTRSDRVAVQALYRTRSAVQRLAVQVPAGAEFDTDPLRINGRSVPLERGSEQQLYVPLVNQTPDKPFLLELRYTIPGGQRRLDFPVFPDSEGQGKAAVQKVYLCVFLPEELTLLGSRGPWTSEQKGWFERRVLHLREDTADAQRIDWVTEGISLPSRPDANFDTDGKLHTFSALQPEDPPAGSLHLIAMPERRLNAILFGSLAIIALIFIRTPVPVKLFAVAVLLIALVLTGVFLPIFAAQVLNGVFLAAMGTVFLVWLVAMAAPRYGHANPTIRQSVLVSAEELRELDALEAKELPQESPPPPAEPADDSEGEDGGPRHA